MATHPGNRRSSFLATMHSIQEGFAHGGTAFANFAKDVTLTTENYSKKLGVAHHKERCVGGREVSCIGSARGTALHSQLKLDLLRFHVGT